MIKELRRRKAWTFKECVLKVVSKIPRGQVRTYKQVAASAGRPQAARAVGNILHRNPRPIEIPCHRVVKSTGEAGGYVYGRIRKIRLLTKEGITIKHRRIL